MGRMLNFLEAHALLPLERHTAAPYLSPWALRRWGPGPGGLPLCRFSGGRRPDAVAGAAAGPYRVRRLSLSMLLGAGGESGSDQSGTTSPTGLAGCMPSAGVSARRGRLRACHPLEDGAAGIGRELFFLARAGRRSRALRK